MPRPELRPAPRALAAVCVLGSALLASGCPTEVVLDEPLPCPCDGGGCTPASCGVRLELESGCGDEMPHARIDIDGHVEDDLLLPGEAFVACSRIEPGETRTLFARGQGWTWGPVDLACPTGGGKLHTLTFRCDEGATVSP